MPPFPQVATHTTFRLDLYGKVVLYAQDEEHFQVVSWLQHVEQKVYIVEELSS